MNLDSPAIEALSAHLLRLSRGSVPPPSGTPRAPQESREEGEVLRRFLPFAELLYLVAAVDGLTLEVERSFILGAFRALTGGRVRGHRLEELEARIREEIADGNVESLLESAASSMALDPKDAELGYALAAALIVSDRVVEAREVELLERLADWMNIHPEKASAD